MYANAQQLSKMYQLSVMIEEAVAEYRDFQARELL